MRSKDQILLENIYNRLLVESPDKVYDNDGTELNWNDSDAFSFGWFKLVPIVDPIYLRAASGSSKVSHDQLANGFCVAFFRSQGNPDNAINNLNNIPVRSSRPWDVIVKELSENQQVAPNQLTPWKNLTSGEVLRDYQYIETNAESTLSSRREVFDNSGRIWLRSKVISFWGRIGEIGREYLDKVMDSFNVSTTDREDFLIDLIDPQRLKDEGTNRKKLPKVSEFFGSKKEKSEPKISKEDEKKIAELLAQKHVEVDPAKRKKIERELGLSDEVKPWGSTLVAQRNPIQKRQAEYTSESYIKESPDEVYNSKGQFLNFGSADGITFGWLNIIPNNPPIFVRSKPSDVSISHYMIASAFLNSFSSSLNEDDPDKIKSSLQKMPFVTYPDVVRLVDIYKTQPNLWKILLRGDLTDEYIKNMDRVQGNDISERSIAYKYSGRVWPKGRVISFWSKLGDVPEDIVYKVFKHLNIPDGENFEIDLMDPQRLELEGTEDKKLPTVKEFFTNKKGASEPITKEQEKKLAELMAKKHTETDPNKRKQMQQELGMTDQVKPWGSTLVAQKNPIQKRQAEFTSESFLDFYSKR
jgi:hypothetical protein